MNFHSTFDSSPSSTCGQLLFIVVYSVALCLNLFDKVNNQGMIKFTFRRIEKFLMLFRTLVAFLVFECLQNHIQTIQILHEFRFGRFIRFVFLQNKGKVSIYRWVGRLIWERGGSKYVLSDGTVPGFQGCLQTPFSRFFLDFQTSSFPPPLNTSPPPPLVP